MRFKPGDVIYRGPERPPFRYLGKSNKEGTDPLREIEFRGEDRRGEGTLVFCDLTTGSKESRIWWQCSDSGLDADADVLRDWIVVELRPDDKVVIIPSTETVPIGHQTSDG